MVLADQRSACQRCMRESGRVWCRDSCANSTPDRFAPRSCEIGTCVGTRFGFPVTSTFSGCSLEDSTIDEDGECFDFSDGDIVASGIGSIIYAYICGPLCCLLICIAVIVAANQQSRSRVVHVFAPAPATNVVYVVGPNGQLIAQPAGSMGGPVQTGPNGQPLQQVVMAHPGGFQQPMAGAAPVMTVSSQGTTVVPTHPPQQTVDYSVPHGTPYDVSPTAPVSGDYGKAAPQNPLSEYGGARPIHSQSNYNQRPAGK